MVAIIPGTVRDLAEINLATEVMVSGRVSGETYDSIQIQVDGTILLGDGTAAPVAAFDSESAFAIANSIETMSRLNVVSNSVSNTTQRQHYTFFRPQQTLLVNRVKTMVGNTLGITLTLAKCGVWSVDGSGNGTLIEKTADEKAQWHSPATTFANVTASFLSEFTLQRGQLYAAGWLFVGATMPTNYGNSTVHSNINNTAPILSSHKDSLADTPASFTAAGNAASGTRVWMYFDHT